MYRLFVCFLLFLVFSCKESDILIRQPQDVKKVYEQKDEKSLSYLISLSEDKNRYVADVGISLLKDVLRRLNDPKDKTYKKTLLGREKEFVNKITEQLIAVFYKKNDFNTKNLILDTLGANQNDPRVDSFFTNVILKEDASKTKIVLSSIKKKEPDEIISLFEKISGEKRLYLLNYYLNYYDKKGDLPALKKILSKEENIYIRKTCLALLEKGDTL